MKYNYQEIERKWQEKWEKEKSNKAVDFDKKNKNYVLDMFPYPSGAGLHVGHVEGYTASDIYCRFLRMKGYNVLHPMGWDAFGLPTENYAIKVKKSPKKITKENTTTFRKQLKSLGFSYDWDREINTSNPEYYKWTQWLFLLLYKKGLAHQKEAPVNWCESCQTVLAREQVVDGACERCKSEVVQKNLKQWFFKITDYAEELLAELDNLDWPESIKEMQRNWIGKSTGINIEYSIEGLDEKIKVFTTRPDTNFGATFITLAPDARFTAKNLERFPNKKKVTAYIEKANRKTEIERMATNRIKTGVFTGLYAINNLNNRKMPVYVGDFVLASVGTGAVVGVPGHDLRDFEFAKAMNLDVIRVVVGPDKDESEITKSEQVQEEQGIMINSGFLDGLDIHQATKKVMDYLEEKGWGKRVVNYKLRDWLISRQRYWGAPIPIIYCSGCGAQPVSKKDLPVELPDDVDFVPKGHSPLADSKKFKKAKCPKCGNKRARREYDTMDTFVCSSWYWLRYLDPKNEERVADSKQVKYWSPIDMYIGGAEHAVLHLLYARFITKVLRDAGIIEFGEPFEKLRNQGLILAEDGQKMSKSLGNVVNPDDVVKEYGADAIRMYEMFMGPLEDAKPWNTKGIRGISRFLEKVWVLRSSVSSSANPGVFNRNLIVGVTDDIKDFKFNTAISKLMVVSNNLTKAGSIAQEDWELFLKALAPFAPHIAEELWQQLDHKESIFVEPWPELKKQEAKKVEFVVQVNGKVRDKVILIADLPEEEVRKLVYSREKIKPWVKGQTIKKEVFVAGRLLNIVI